MLMSKKRVYFYVKLLLLLSLSLCFSKQLNAAEWVEIKKREKLIIGVKNNLRPLGYEDLEGNLQGFEIDIGRRLAEELLGDINAVEFVPVNNSQRLSIVINDEVDLVIANVIINPSRQRIVNFSIDYYFDSIAIITKKNQLQLSNISTMRIAVLNNSATIDEIKSSFPNAKLIGVASYQEALSFLENNQADSFIGNLTILSGWVQEYPQYQILPPRLSGYPLGIVMPKGLQYQELRTKVNETIQQWKKEGWLEKRAKFWGLN